MSKLLATTILGVYLFAMGGMPAAHFLSGKDWGMAVSELAKSAPGAIKAAHEAL